MTRTDSDPFPGLALDGELLIYDRTAPTAWVQSSDHVSLTDWR